LRWVVKHDSKYPYERVLMRDVCNDRLNIYDVKYQMFTKI